MKKITLLFTILFAAVLNSSRAQNTWTPKANFGGGGRVEAVEFSIDSKGYMGTGWDGSVSRRDLWEYDPSTGAWTQKADLGGPARWGAVGFSIGNKGYVGTGDSVNFSEQNLNDFWEYDPASNSWTQKANLGGPVRRNAVGFSIYSKGYIGTGWDGSSALNDFWEYDPSTDTWIQKANFGGVARLHAVGFSINSKGYLGTGYFGFYNDFWEYDPLTNAWTQKANVGGGGRSDGVGFAIGNKGYISTGDYGIPNYKKDFWEYDPSTNAWTQKADFGGTARHQATGFSIGSKGYIGTGYDGSYRNDFWEYTPGTSTINSQDSLALVALYNGTGGANWTNSENWLTINPVSTWYGITLTTTDTRVSKIALPNNNLNGNIPVSLGKLKFLQYLRLDSNQLTGHIPFSFGKLKSLVVLNLKYNNLRGNIPYSLGDLSNLQHLVLTHNNLKGNIPSSFSNLKNLRRLRLRDNHLSGIVPAFLGTLPNLKRLVILHNNYTFDGLETLVQNNQLDSFKYARQRAIDIHQNNNALSVYAGGTLSNNTYKWFNNGALVSTITGDSTFTPTASGNYNVEVTNSIATELTLRSDTVSFNTLKADQQNNLVAKAIDKTGFSLYPNPVKDVLHVDNLKGNATISIITQDGRMVDTKIISNSTYAWNVKSLAAGTYYIRVVQDKKTTLLKFVKQ